LLSPTALPVPILEDEKAKTSPPFALKSNGRNIRSLVGFSWTLPPPFILLDSVGGKAALLLSIDEAIRENEDVLIFVPGS
jgi:hypothetical protein